MNSPESDWVESDLTYQVVGCALTVMKELGHGFREKTYERALCVEFKNQGLAFSQQHQYPVFYREEHIDDYIPDIEVDNRLILEVKTVDKIIDEHIGQILNYLRISKLEAGVILNFKHARLAWKKVVLQQ